MDFKYFAPLSSFKPKHKRLSETIDFIKIGDTVEARNSLGVLYGGTVIGFPKTFSGVFKIKKSNGEEHTVSILWRSTIKVNGVERKPEFYIKRKRKIYGANKR